MIFREEEKKEDFIKSAMVALRGKLTSEIAEEMFEISQNAYLIGYSAGKKASNAKKESGK